MIVLGSLAVAFGSLHPLAQSRPAELASVRGTIVRSDLQTTADGKTRLAAAFRYQIGDRVIDSRQIIITIEDTRPAVVYRSSSVWPPAAASRSITTPRTPPTPPLITRPWATGWRPSWRGSPWLPTQLWL